MELTPRSTICTGYNIQYYEPVWAKTKVPMEAITVSQHGGNPTQTDRENAGATLTITSPLPSHHKTCSDLPKYSVHNPDHAVDKADTL